MKDKVLLELGWNSKFSTCVSRVVVFSKLADSFASAGKSNVWRWKKTDIACRDGFAARIQCPAFVFVQWGGQTCGGRDERTTWGWLSIIRWPAFFVRVIHIPGVNSIYCALFDFVCQKIGDIMYGETSTPVEFGPALLFVLQDSGPYFTTGNKQYFGLNWRRFVQFVNQEIVLAAQYIQQYVSRVYIFVLETENVAGIKA